MEDVRHLTGKIASGNPEAFARLYRARFGHMYTTARQATGFDEAACLDIVQDAMMRVIRYIKPLEDTQALDNWLTRVARTVAYDHLRRERRRRMRERKAALHRSEVISEDTDELRDRIEGIRGELRGLDRATREIIELRFRTGLTLEAIGEFLGIGAGTVHRRLRKAIARLRKKTTANE